MFRETAEGAAEVWEARAWLGEAAICPRQAENHSAGTDPAAGLVSAESDTRFHHWWLVGFLSIMVKAKQISETKASDKVILKQQQHKPARR